jgi:hypothetical protein
LLGLLGFGSLLSNTLSIVLSWNRVPLHVELLGLLYGGVAVAAALQVWTRGPHARGLFLAWGFLVAVFAALVTPGLDQPLRLLAPTALLAALVFFGQRYIAKQAARAA